YDQALKYYQKAIELDENQPDAWVGIGVIMDIRGNSAEALQHVKRGINIDPTRGTYWFILGDIQLKLGMKLQAEESYRKVIEFEPENEEIWMYYSDILFEENRLEEAREFLQQAEKYHPGNARLTFQQCELELRSGNDRSALILAEIAISMDSEMAKKMTQDLTHFGLNAEIRRLIQRYTDNNE
ncbi:MAG: tetratricopeptide repeat protein, partial [Bacteroidetes bacterium]|nr:tetratricopeptide repeat protein [Bacteroidota bacterium]